MRVEPLVGVEQPRALGLAGHGDPDTQPGVPGIGRSDRVHPDHVVAAAADRHAGVEPLPIRDGTTPSVSGRAP